MSDLNLVPNKLSFKGPTFSLGNRVRRSVWKFTWLISARWTPAPMHKLRILILKIFGAKVAWSAYIYPDVKIWAPWNLYVAEYATLARNVICYNIAPINLGVYAVVSQGTHLCTGSHDFLDPTFPLTARPIDIGRRAWICADAFIGPGVSVGDGAILAAAGVAHHDLLPWSIYRGNPAVFLRSRSIIND